MALPCWRVPIPCAARRRERYPNIAGVAERSSCAADSYAGHCAYHVRSSFMASQLPADFQRRTILKASRRLLPLVAVAYVVSYVDRTNVAFASLTMNKDLGISAYFYGLGAGIF